MNIPKRWYLGVKIQTQLKYIKQYKIILGNHTFLNDCVTIIPRSPYTKKMIIYGLKEILKMKEHYTTPIHYYATGFLSH